jgi:hypothetical protein
VTATILRPALDELRHQHSAAARRAIHEFALHGNSASYDAAMYEVDRLDAEIERAGRAQGELPLNARRFLAAEGVVGVPK